MVSWMAVVLNLSLITVITSQYRDPYRRHYYYFHPDVNWPVLYDWRSERNHIMDWMDQFLSDINKDIIKRYNMVAQSNPNLGSSNSQTAIPAVCRVLYKNGKRRPRCDERYAEDMTIIVRPEYNQLPRGDYGSQKIPFICRKLKGVRRCRPNVKPKEIKVSVYVMADKGKATETNEQLSLTTGKVLDILSTADPSQCPVTSKSLELTEENKKNDLHFVHDNDINLAKATSSGTFPPHFTESDDAKRDEPESFNDAPQLDRKTENMQETKPLMNDINMDEKGNGEDKIKGDKGGKKKNDEDKGNEKEIEEEKDSETTVGAFAPEKEMVAEKLIGQQREKQKEEPKGEKKKRKKGGQDSKTISMKRRPKTDENN